MLVVNIQRKIKYLLHNIGNAAYPELAVDAPLRPSEPYFIFANIFSYANK